MKDFIRGFREGLKKALYIPPVYASHKGLSDAALVEGWKIAYQQEKERRIEAENMLTELMPAVTEQDRDELARLLAKVEPVDWEARSPRSPVKYFALQDADRLLKAGYRKMK